MTIIARMAEELSKRELQFALNRPALERQHQAAIASAQAALAAFEKEQAPKIAEEQRKQSRSDGEARSRSQGIRDDGSRQEDRRLGKGEDAARSSIAGR